MILIATWCECSTGWFCCTCRLKIGSVESLTGSIRFSTKHAPSVPSWCARPSWPTHQSPGNVEWNRGTRYLVDRECKSQIESRNSTKLCRFVSPQMQLSSCKNHSELGSSMPINRLFMLDSYIYINYIITVSYLTNTTYPDANIYHFHPFPPEPSLGIRSTPIPVALPKVPTPSVLEICPVPTNRQK